MSISSRAARIARMGLPIVVGSAAALAAACGQAASTGPAGGEPLAPAESESAASVGRGAVLFEYRVDWHAASQKLDLVPIHGSQALQPKGFVHVTPGNMSASTGANVIGPAAVGSASYPDGCPSSVACAKVTVTNNSGLAMQDVFVEVTSITAGFAVANSDPLPSPLYSPPLTGTYGRWAYGSLGNGGSATKEWRVSLPSTNDFTFSIRGLATFTRTHYSAPTSSAGGFVDACAMPGFTRVLVSKAASFTTIYPKFPIALYDRVRTEAVVTTDGVLVFGEAGLDPHDALNTTAAYDYALYPYWDEALQTGTDGICYATDPDSSSPNRRFVVTWKNAKRGGLTFSFSAIISEGSDDVRFVYADRGSDPKENGALATIGIRGPNASTITQFSHNTASLDPDAMTLAFAAQPRNP